MDSSMKSFNPNKHLKEQFVSNLTGSSLLELFLVITTLSVLILIRRAIGYKIEFGPTVKEASLKKNDDMVVNKSFRAYIAGITVDFLTIFVPFILFLTVLSEWMYLNVTVVILLLLISLASRRYGSFDQEDVPSLRENVSSYRVSVMLLTCLCILAVDFTIYPRRYAKAETYGTGLMDLGVGSFVLANSFVSRQARGISRMILSAFILLYLYGKCLLIAMYGSYKVLTDEKIAIILIKYAWTIYVRSLRNAVRSSSPLILLGFARLVFTSGVDYQVHVGEYGIHWNFFFTLAAVAILTSLINLPPKYCGILGILILAGYQYFLLQGLNEYLLSDKRGTSIISQNKEGICSIFGYWGMYLVGVQLGDYLLFGNQMGNLSRANKRAKIRVWILCLLFWSLTLFLDQLVERASRRMCNGAYVTLVLAVNLQVMAIAMLSDFIPGSKLSLLEEAFNQNLLGSFLLANVLTGFVNLSIDTLFVPSASALGILLVYTFILCASVGSLYFCGIRLKFW